VVAGRANRRDRGSGNYDAGMTLPRPTGAYRYGVSAWGRLRRTARRHPFGTDATVAAVLCVLTLLVAGMSPSLRGRLTVEAAGLAVVTWAPLPWRRRWPVPVLAVSTVSAAGYIMLTQAHGLIFVAPLVALYTVAGAGGRRRALAIGIIVLTVLAGVHMLLRPRAWIGWETLAVFAAVGLALAAADAASSRRAYIAEITERARRAELGREQEARRRVTEERLRIARDLHDAVGHHLALINVQAGVADQLLDDDPVQARQSLAHIRQASRSALDDLRDTIGLLRQPGEPAAPVQPTADLNDLDELMASFGRSGLRVERTVEGAVRPVPPAASLIAYRVIQESLTNVRKHAGDSNARIRLSYRPAALWVEVDNMADSSGSSLACAGGGNGSGHGITGMRERVAAAGGSLAAGPRPGGGFRVSALLPLPADGGS
jgi:signal transduction histidine kinase